jgi:hypothetical protein
LKQANNLEIGLTALNKICFELAGKRVEVALEGSDLFSTLRLLIAKSDGYMAIYKNDKFGRKPHANLVFDSNENIILGIVIFKEICTVCVCGTNTFQNRFCSKYAFANPRKRV